ncbi:hypothetical protein L1D19_23260 [Vibrio natriegens]|uniref:hypothetical protein n=1 Tax=Vibrio natriegens TaxID=691 RepID=UPI001EFC7210|nr:hypothetical protein [Vibrio natriegens]MCG9702987.1 hypothetical protein [Vibrio natriegens]
MVRLKCRTVDILAELLLFAGMCSLKMTKDMSKIKTTAIGTDDQKSISTDQTALTSGLHIST